MTKMTKEEMAKRIEELEKVNEELKKHSGQTVKDRIIELIESGMNTIEDLAETLSITSKNVSSNLTKIRHELSSKNETGIFLFFFILCLYTIISKKNQALLASKIHHHNLVNLLFNIQ